MTDRDARDDALAMLPQLNYELPIDAFEWLTRVFGFVEKRACPGRSYTASYATHVTHNLLSVQSSDTLTRMLNSSA
jgi:hypothetical protein